MPTAALPKAPGPAFGYAGAADMRAAGPAVIRLPAAAGLPARAAPGSGRPPHVIEGSVGVPHGVRRVLDLDEHPPPSLSDGPVRAAVPATKMSLRLSQAVRCPNLPRQDYDARFDHAVYTHHDLCDKDMPTGTFAKSNFRGSS